MEETTDMAAAAAFDPNLSIDKNGTMQTAETALTDSTFSSFQEFPMRFQTPTQRSAGRASQPIPPHDVLLSSQKEYRTRANFVYDNFLLPKRTMSLNVALVKKDLHTALMNDEGYRKECGFRKTPLPKFWLPADKVEKSPWKGKTGTERTFLVGKKKRMRVYEASDAWIVRENYGNSTRHKGAARNKQSMEACTAELRVMFLSDDGNQRKAARSNSLKQVEKATQRVLAEGREWAKDSNPKLFSYTLFAKDISRIEEWSRSIGSYGRWYEDIRAAHFQQLEERLVQLVEDLYGDMKIHAQLGDSRVKVPQPNNGSFDRSATQSSTERVTSRNERINPSVPPYNCQSNKEKEYVDQHTHGGFFPPAPPPSYQTGAATEQFDCRVDGGLEIWSDQSNDETLSRAYQEESSFRTHGHDRDVPSSQTSSPDATTAFDFPGASSSTSVQDHKRKASSSGSEPDGLGLPSATKRSDEARSSKCPSKPPFTKTHRMPHKKKRSTHGMLDKQEEAPDRKEAAFSGSDTSFKSFYAQLDDQEMARMLHGDLTASEGFTDTDCDRGSSFDAIDGRLGGCDNST